MLVRKFWALLLAIPLSAHAQQPTAQVVTPGIVPEVTLPDAIALANKVQPSVVTAQAGITQAKAQKLVTVGAWLPSLNGTAGTGYFYSTGTRVDPNTGQIIGANQESETINLGISTSWDVFTGFRRFCGHKGGQRRRLGG